MIRKPEQQVEHMQQANVRPGYNPRRPESDLEIEDESKRSVRPPK